MRISEGHVVTGKYLGLPVTGIVTDSRVKYGGKIQYTIALAKPLVLPWRQEEVVTCVLNHDELVGI